VKLRDTQASLVQSEKMAALGNLVAGVAHEINSPLGSIGSSADTIKRALRVIESALYDGEAASQDERVNKAFQTLVTLNESVSGGVERINRIVTALRNFARLDEGEYQSFDVNGGIEDTLTLVLANPEVHVEVEKDLGPLPELYCRPRELNQVFINILNNALEATGSRGRITIKTREDDDRIRIQITDNGPGIPPEGLARVFEPGYTTKGRGVGTGLGLAISYRIIEDHGGTISIESQPGEGTTVFLALPIKSCQSSSGSEPRA
jgi:signal transduction histidine kinase